MTLDACTWDHPGADRYTGSAEAAIHAFAEIPPATQAELVRSWNARAFDDFVVIDRDSIRGQHGEYGPGIRRMHFGSRGRICASVTRAGWSGEHVETAVVLCADGWCVAAPTVCSNWFLIDRREPVGIPAAAAFIASPYEAGPGVLPVVPEGSSTALSLGKADEIVGSYATVGDWSGSGGGGYVGLCTSCSSTSVSPIPDAATWLLILAGLGLVATQRRRT